MKSWFGSFQIQKLINASTEFLNYDYASEEDETSCAGSLSFTHTLFVACNSNSIVVTSKDKHEALSSGTDSIDHSHLLHTKLFQHDPFGSISSVFSGPPFRFRCFWHRGYVAAKGDRGYFPYLYRCRYRRGYRIRNDGIDQ